MSVFAAGIRAIFNDRNLAADVTYRAGGFGAGVSVRAIAAQPDVVLDYQATQIRSDSTLIDVQVSEVAAPAQGDVFVVDGVEMVVDGEPARDDHRLVWRVGLVPVSDP